MAQIPLNTGGNVIATAPGRRPYATPDDFGNAGAVGQVGATLANIGFSNLQAIADQNIADQKQRIAEAKHAQALNNRVASITAKASIDNDLADEADRQKQAVLAGRYKPDATIHDQDGNEQPDELAGKNPIAEFQQRTKDIVGLHVQGLAPEDAALVKAETVRAAGVHANEIGDSILHRSQQDVGVQLVAAREELEREALRDRPVAIAKYNAIINAIGPRAGMDPKAAANEKASFSEKAAYNAGRMMVVGARDNVASLSAVAQTLQQDKDLSPDRLAPLLTTIEMRKQTVVAQQAAADARAAAAQQRRLTEAGIAVAGYEKIVDNGGAPDQRYALDVATAVAGTPYAAQLKELTKTAGERAGFASLSPTEQRAQLDRMRADANANGTDPDNEKRIATRQTIFDKGQKQLAADPLVYGANRGLIPGITPLQMGGENPIGSIAAGLATRIDAAKTVSAHVGQPVSPLTSDEANTLSQTINSLPVASRARALKVITAAVPDPSQVRALASQMNEKDPAVGLALLAGQHQTDTGRPLAELILAGSDAHRTKMLDETGMVPTMRSIANKVAAVPWSTPAARDAAILASQLVYRGQKASGIPTSEDNSIVLAVGGITTWADGKIPLPYGATESSFKTSMRAMDAQRLTEQAGADHVMVRGQSVPMSTLASSLPSTTLLPAGDGVYVLQSGNAIVQLPNGKPFKLRVQ